MTRKVATQIICLEVSLMKHCWLNYEEVLHYWVSLSRIITLFWVTFWTIQLIFGTLNYFFLIETDLFCFLGLGVLLCKISGLGHLFFSYEWIDLSLYCILSKKVLLLAIFIFEDVTFSTGASNLVSKLKCVVLPSYIGFILVAEFSEQWDSENIWAQLLI